MYDFRVCQIWNFDQQNKYNSLGNHSQWVFLHHTLSTIENSGRPIPVFQDEVEVVTK